LIGLLSDWNAATPKNRDNSDPGIRLGILGSLLLAADDLKPVFGSSLSRRIECEPPLSGLSWNRAW